MNRRHADFQSLRGHFGQVHPSHAIALKPAWILACGRISDPSTLSTESAKSRAITHTVPTASRLPAPRPPGEVWAPRGGRVRPWAPSHTNFPHFGAPAGYPGTRTAYRSSRLDRHNAFIGGSMSLTSEQETKISSNDPGRLTPRRPFASSAFVVSVVLLRSGIAAATRSMTAPVCFIPTGWDAGALR